MSCCTLFNKSFIQDIDIKDLTIDIEKIRPFIAKFDPVKSGLWQPAIIRSNNSQFDYTSLLSQASGSIPEPIFNPCNCENTFGGNSTYDDILDNVQQLSCSYCTDIVGSNTQSWAPSDINSETASPTINVSCCDGSCDVRTQKDDFVPKIPYLNQSLIKDFYDFKYLKEFPSVQNAPLGFEQFISSKKTETNSLTGAKVCVDWKIQESISEIGYNELTSTYDKKYDHEKAYTKNLKCSKTCGNFLLTKINTDYEDNIIRDYPRLSGLIGQTNQTTISNNIADILPPPTGFSKPYGFDSQTYNNIFIKNVKAGSYWKWQYQSGVLFWYRYFDVPKDTSVKDDRLIRGIDLYISPGDVFFAKNDGPEPSFDIASTNNNGVVKSCPSGLKLIKDSDIYSIIPSGSEFLYISENIYEKFYTIYSKITSANILDQGTKTPYDRLVLSALLATAPAYDQITLDLFKRNPNDKYPINEYMQLSGFNKDMSTSSIGSVSKINFVKNNESFINTLANKYGSYLWCPPNTGIKIELKQNIDTQCLIDIDFDMMIKKTDTLFPAALCSPTTDCTPNRSRKNFSYTQSISLGNSKIETLLDYSQRYDAKCISGEMQEPHTSALTAAIALNNKVIKEIPYSTGCYTLENIYPRISDINTQESCLECSSLSSYGLYVSRLSEGVVCCSGRGNSSFCDHLLAKKCDIADPLITDNPETESLRRLRRTIIDGSLYLLRSYPVNAFNGRIDKAAFHTQGGVYFTSKAFDYDNFTIFAQDSASLGDGKPSVSFTTKDAGIKIYNLEIQKLRSDNPDSYGCLGFPLPDQACKCMPIRQISGYPYKCDNNRVFTNTPLLFTPNLSTSTDLRLKAYGGYSEDELNKILGTHRIPDHPEPNTFLEILDRKIDPEYPYGCELTTTPLAILPNYTNTSWSLNLPNLNTEHSDIWIQSLESVPLNIKRYATKITINDITLYSQQKKKFLNMGDALTTSVVINLKNPYLSKLLGETAQDSVLYPPVGSFPAGTVPHVLNGRTYAGPGDELNTVSLEFSRKPRQQILNFVIANPLHNQYNNEHLTLTKGFFHPNSGLQKSIDRENRNFNKSPILYKPDTKNYFFNYENEKFNTPHTDGYVFVGKLNDEIKTVLNKINNFDYHKKLKLYLELDGQWYEYSGSSAYGFVQNNILYPGSPTLFNYLDSEKKNSIIGSIIPSVPKKISKIPFLYNYGNRPLYSSTPDSYPLPLLNGTKNLRSTEDKTTRIPGVRPYFYVAETDNAVISQASTIGSLSAEDQQQISDFRTDIILSNKDRYRYKGSGEKNDPKSYILIDYNYLYTNFSDLNINYSSKSSLGYVYTTKKNCYQKVNIINKNNLLQVYEAYIVEKKIYAIDVDKNGTVLSALNRKNDSQAYIQIWTEFTFDRNIKYSEFYIDFTNLYIDINNTTNGMDSIILLDKKHILKKETDVYLSNPEYQAKWYDLLGYDNILVNDITKLLSSKTIINQKYPQSTYENFFYKTIINNTNYNQYNYVFEFAGRDSPINVYYTGLVYYTIHQKYNINADTNLSTISGQHNYLPFMDINFVPTPRIIDNTNADLNKFRSNIEELSRQLYNKNDVNQENPRDNLLVGLSGYLYISGIYTNLDKNHIWSDPMIDPNKESLYWLNIDQSAKFKSALPFDTSRENFFSSTLRIDDPFYQLYTVDETARTSGEGDCGPNRIFRPYTNNSYSYIDNMFNFNSYNSGLKYGNIFDSSPIYCDIDKLGACGNETCNIKSIGNISYSGQYIFFQEQELATSILQKINNVKCILSYDAGNYNTILSTKTQPSYIQRFELDPDNPINPYAQRCNRSTFAVRPQRSGSYTFDTEYQDTLKNSIVDDHSDIVVNTDIMANEMLFRLLYGEKQKINLNRLDQDDSKPITYNDLFRSTNNIQAKDIYKNIPYEYDITSNSENRKVSGSISINGILAVGKNVNVNINGANIAINIVREDGKILIRATAAGQTKETVLYNEYIDSNLTIVTTEPKVFDSNGKLLPLLATCPGISNTTWGFVNGVTSATLHNIPDCNGELVDIEFPYWQTSADKGGGPHPCTACCPYPCRLPGDAFCGVCQGQVPGGHAPILFLNIYAGAKFSCYDADKTLCTNRDVGALVIPGEIADSKSHSLTVDGSKPNRGVMNGNCAVNGGVTHLRNGFEDPVRNFGNIESCLVLPIEMWEDGEQIDKNYTGSNKPFLRFTNLPLEAGYNLGSIKYFPNTEYVIPDWRWNYISDPTYGPSPDIAYRPAICIGGDPTTCFDVNAQGAVAEAKILPAWYRMALWGGYNRIITQPLTISNLITKPPSPCGDCYTLDSTDWTGNARSEPTIGFPGQVCECRPYTYGYCQNVASAATCLCDTLRQDYIEFDYNFEYCRYDFTLTGHRKKIIGHRENPEEQVNTSVSCNGSADSWARIKNEWKVSVDLVEECVWYSNTSQGTDWYIHNFPTRYSNEPYNPGCPQNLCNITYDNNKTIITIGTEILCINNRIRNNCPEITINLPDNSFTFTETIDSECGICGVDPTNIEMVEQTQPWETVTDTRTCVLGTLLVGKNKNLNGPTAIGGYQFTKCGVCSRCDPMSCSNDSFPNMGIGQCGQNAPDSFPWSTCYSRANGDMCTGGSVPYRKDAGWPFWADGWDDTMSFISDTFSYSEIGITVWRDYGSDLSSTLPSIKGCDGQISMPLWTSNGKIKSSVISQWESQMQYNYSKIAACKAPEYNVEDVVEGVVGECSDLKFKTISYPGITYRATLGDPQVEETTIDVKVAYYTYQYKRPKTIQDILLDTNVGPGIGSKCSSINSQCVTSANINLIEKFKTDNCTKAVTCYDNNTTSCRPNDFCCQYNK